MTPQNGKTPGETISLSIPSLPKYLHAIRCFISELAELTGFSPQDRDRICLAVGEACSNIIRHSYRGKPDGIIILRCALYHDRMKISIRDFGEKIDLSRVHPPDFGSTQAGGLGVHMIRRMMDEVVYEITHEVGTEIHMTKFLPPAGGTR